MQGQQLLLENTPAAYYRAGRLRVKQANLCWGYTLDLFTGVIFPAAIGAGMAAIAQLVLINIDGSAEWIQQNIYSEQVLSALGTMIVFLVTMRLGTNLSRNGAIIGHFGNLCGACVNLAIWSRSLVTSGKLEVLMYPNGNGSTYRTTEIGLVLASIPYAIKYTYRNIDVKLDQLPVGASPALLQRTVQLTTSKDNYVGVSPFLALVMVLGERFDDLEAAGQIKAPELGIVFAQLNALTGEEGSIGGIQGYAPPGVLNFLLYTIFALYYLLLILGDLGANNGWQSLWIVGVLIVTNFGIWQISEKYANPFTVSVKTSTQTPLISDSARGTEVAIDGVFGRKRLVGDGPGGGGGPVPPSLSFGLGLGRA
jgi:hypothetical protein